MRVLVAILLGGSVAGTLYLMSVLATLVPRGASVRRVLQYIAGGVLGDHAFDGGWTTAAFGLALHFTFATVMAAAFVIAARRLPFLVERPWSAGIAYGALLYAAMTYVVVPISAAPIWFRGHGWEMVGGLMAHCFFVGVPIAAIARRFRQRKRERLAYGA